MSEERIARPVTSAEDLGWRFSRGTAPERGSDSDLRAATLMLSHVDAQADADLPRLRRLEAKLSDLGWEMPPERRAFVYQSAADRNAASAATLERIKATLPEGSTWRALLEKAARPPAPVDREAERRRQMAALAEAERRAP